MRRINLKHQPHIIIFRWHGFLDLFIVLIVHMCRLLLLEVMLSDWLAFATPGADWFSSTGKTGQMFLGNSELTTAVKNSDILATSCECFLAFAGLLCSPACPAWVLVALWVFCLNLRPASKAKKQKAWKKHEKTTTPGNNTTPPSLLLSQCQDFLRLFQLHGSDSSPMRKQ